MPRDPSQVTDAGGLSAVPSGGPTSAALSASSSRIPAAVEAAALRGRSRGHSTASTTTRPIASSLATSIHNPPPSHPAKTTSSPILPPPDDADADADIDPSQSHSPSAEPDPTGEGEIADRVLLSLYTYTPSAVPPSSAHHTIHHGAHGTSTSASAAASASTSASAHATQNKVLLAHAALPWPVRVGDYVEIRAVRLGESSKDRATEGGGRGGGRDSAGEAGGRDGKAHGGNAGGRGAASGTGTAGGKGKAEAEALEGVRKARRQGCIFRVGEDVPSVPHGQIQVPSSVAHAFKLQHRLDVEVVRIKDPETAYVDFIELEFSQYVGRADMWRLGMLLENTTVHVGEKVSLAGGAVRADVRGIYRGRHRYSSGIVTAKTKTIYRSKSAQTYLFIQLSQETWEFDEDGERYYEKVLHGFLPELFARWTATGASHLVTIILFARVYYDAEEVTYLEQLDLTAGLGKDFRGRWCKDFFRVIVDFERKADWRSALGEIKRHLEKSEREILMDFHLGRLMGTSHEDAQKRIVGKWSFAYEGNVLETINLALNPFDEHYIDRDLSRTGLSMTIITPGTGHFAVDKNLLRLTTERMIDHGIGLDLVCLTKMPLHSVPLFSYVSERPRRVLGGEIGQDGKVKPATPDPLYFDADMINAQDRELADCYSLAFWVYCSFYSKTHDKPFRNDRFIPRCKMYEIQMLGILDHNLTTVIVPLLDIEDGTTSAPSGAPGSRAKKPPMSAEDRKLARTNFDSTTFGGGGKRLPVDMYLSGGEASLSAISPAASARRGSLSASGPTSFQSARLLAQKMEEEEAGLRTGAGGKSTLMHTSPGRAMQLAGGRRGLDQITAHRRNREDTSPPASSRYARGRIVTGPATDSLEEVEGMEQLVSARASTLDQPISLRGVSPPGSSIRAAASPSRTSTRAPRSTAPGEAGDGRNPRPSSPSASSVLSNDQVASGASTPRTTGTTGTASAKRLKSQSSRGSFASRFGASWLFGRLGGASAQPSFPTAAVETASRTDVVQAYGGNKSSPTTSVSKDSSAGGFEPVTTMPRPMAVPGAPTVSPATPVTAKPKQITQPLPIGAGATTGATKAGPVGIGGGGGGGGGGGATARLYNADEVLSKSLSKSIPRSFHNSIRLGRSVDDSYRNKLNAAYGRATRHATVNPCNPSANRDLLGRGSGGGDENGGTGGAAGAGGHGRRWQHVRPTTTTSGSTQHVVKWRSLCAPACLPLTTDFMPTPEEISTFYEVNSYDIACFPDQVSFLVRPDAAQANLPLAVMREMASQRLSQNFQFIVLPHSTIARKDGTQMFATHKVLLAGDSTSAGLRVGGASEVLKDANGAIYLSWSNHIHRLSFDPMKQSVTVQRFVRKTKHSTKSHAYKCLVWPAQTKGYQETSTLFKYPNISARLNFNYLDRLIAGEEEDLTSNLRYWRTRYILIPSGRDPLSVQGVTPKGEHFNQSDIMMIGAQKVLELLGRWQWRRPGEVTKPLKLLGTTFDPSACVLDEGLMTELERVTSGKETIEKGKTIEGLTLQAVADMMNKPNNGLIIRDRWWNFHVHEDSFTGDQFCLWLMTTFTDIETRDHALEWGRSLFDKGLIEHVTGVHKFHDNYFFYRLRAQYDEHSSKAKKPSGKSWFGKSTQTPREVMAQHSAGSSSASSVVGSPDQAQSQANAAHAHAHAHALAQAQAQAQVAAAAAAAAAVTASKAPLKLTEKPAKKRKVKMSQQIVIDLDPSKKSDRAEVAILHADIIHNARNAFHFELNWLGVTAALLDELRGKCSTLAERYGLRFVEAPVEQIKDISSKCPYRTAIPIRLALAPPVIPDLHLRIPENSSVHTSHYFEYAILCQKFGFVLDVEASDRYPDSIEVEYSYRAKQKFEFSQFCHKSGLALVQCLGREEGFLWSDNRLFITAPARGREREVGKGGVGGGGGGAGAGGSNSGPSASATTTLGMSKLEQAAEIRARFEAFCADPIALQQFYDEVTPKPIATATTAVAGAVADAIAEADETASIGSAKEKEKEKEREKEKTEDGFDV